MNEEIEILVNGKPTKMKLPPDLQDSKIVVEDDKVFVETGIVDYINNLYFENQELKQENQRLNNVLNKLKKIKIILDDYYAYDYDDENLERLNVLDKINAIVKESDK